MKIMNTNGEKIGLSVNLKHKKRNQNKNTNAKTKNMKYTKPKYKQISIIMKQESIDTKK